MNMNMDMDMRMLAFEVCIHTKAMAWSLVIADYPSLVQPSLVIAVDLKGGTLKIFTFRAPKAHEENFASPAGGWESGNPSCWGMGIRESKLLGSGNPGIQNPRHGPPLASTLRCFLRMYDTIRSVFWGPLVLSSDPT